MPKLDAEQRRIVRLIRKEGRNIKSRKLRRKYERAAVQTGIVESNLRNLKYGDRDSQGWRQERTSLYPNPTNLKASIRRFRQEFQQHADPGEPSYEVAAQVQRPAEQYRGRYQEEAGEAAAILRQYGRGGDLPAAGRRARVSTSTNVRNRYDTVPAVDKSGLRKDLMLNYLDERGQPGAILGLRAELEAAQDVPSRRVLVGRDRTITRQRGGGNGALDRMGGSRSDATPGIGGELKELFYNGPGGINVDNGQRVGKGFVPGHEDHVHVAGGPRSVDTLGRMAMKMGLNVGENETFGPVGGHTEGSFHYEDMAIDVSGSRRKMRKFNRRVARLYGV